MQAAATALKPLLTVRQVGNWLGLSRAEVYRRVAAGEIPHLRLGADKRAPIRFDPDELQEWLEAPRMGKETA